MRKIRQYINFETAILEYKQTILPILDYVGFVCLSLNVEDKKDLQIMQNDALCFCYNIRLSDRVTIVNLHEQAELSSLE